MRQTCWTLSSWECSEGHGRVAFDDWDCPLCSALNKIRMLEARLVEAEMERESTDCAVD